MCEPSTSGVGHQDDLVVPKTRDVLLVADPDPDRGDQRADLLVLQHLVEPGLLDVQDLPAQRQDRLELAVAALLRRTARAVPLDEEQLALRRVARVAVGELSGEATAFEEALPSGELAGLASRLARLGRLHRLRRSAPGRSRGAPRGTPRASR